MSKGGLIETPMYLLQQELEDAKARTALQLTQPKEDNRPKGTGWARDKGKERFVHAHAKGYSYDPKSKKYYYESESGQQTECPPPHDPLDYPIHVAISSASNLGAEAQAPKDVVKLDRTVLLKELVKTGALLKQPLFFLDHPSSCFVLFSGVRGGAAAEWCSKQFHPKLFRDLSSKVELWKDDELKTMLATLMANLDEQLLQQPGTCYAGCSVSIALLTGDRLVVASLGAGRVLLLPPDRSVRVLNGNHQPGNADAKELERVLAAGGEVVDPQKDAARTAGEKEERGPEGPGRDSLLRKKRRLHEKKDVGEDAMKERSQEEEIRRIVTRAEDSFAVLCIGEGTRDALDPKTARSFYKKLALKIHPDKVSDELKTDANLAFQKAEDAVKMIEAFVEVSKDALGHLFRILTVPCPPSRGQAMRLLSLAEYPCNEQEAKRSAEGLRKMIKRLHVQATRDPKTGDECKDLLLAFATLDECLDLLLCAPARKSDELLVDIGVTRALGLRDLKRPRQIVSSEVHLEIHHLEQRGRHHLVMLGEGAAALSVMEIVDLVRNHALQPKVASMLLSQAAAKRCEEIGRAQPGTGAASCVIGILDVKDEEIGVPSEKKKKLNTDQTKICCAHILLKHTGIMVSKDKQAHLRGQDVTRTLEEAEKQMLQMLQEIESDPSSFRRLARQVSECESSRVSGELGWFPRGSFEAQFEDVAFNMKPGTLSDIVSTSRGVHLIHRQA